MSFPNYLENNIEEYDDIEDLSDAQVLVNSDDDKQWECYVKVTEIREVRDHNFDPINKKITNKFYPSHPPMTSNKN